MGAAGSRGWRETCGHVASMAPACHILRWVLTLGLGLTFEVLHAFRSQGRGGPGATVGREKGAEEGSVGLGWQSMRGRPCSQAAKTRVIPKAHPKPLTLTHR